ncbi:MAG: NADH-quinone oxidoreductase subunit H [Candidatus Nanoarchaeia archaeon]|nr:NADH-quinone oxidoreductase subunit H [Candidatus Nanoarchaeia archaeon]
MSISMSINLILFILSPVFALLANGIFRKAFARFQCRKGPPIIQPFYDMMKLWKKKRAEAEESKNIVFYAGLFLALFFLIILYSIFFGIISFDHDFILFIYLLVSIEVAIICSAFASKNAFSYVGSMRELVLMIGYELIIAFSIINIMGVSGETSIFSIESSAISFPLSAFLLFISGFAVLRITPFDTVNAHTEISSGMPSEYSGKLLMMYYFAERLKEFIYCIFLSKIIIGWNMFTPIIAVILIIIYALMNASSARYSFLEASKRLFLMAIISFINLGWIGL